MRTALGVLLLAVCCSASHHQVTIPSGSTIYVDSRDGFDKFMEEAFESRHVALRVVTSPENADYTLESTVYPTWDVVQGRRGQTAGSKSEAAVKLTSKADEVVWRLTVSEGTLKRGGKAVAEECAKHLKDLVGGKPKP